MKLLPLSIALIALAGAAVPLHATTPQSAPTSRPGRGLHDIPDPELNTLRGRYTIGSNAVVWFGVQMVSTWQTGSGQVLQGTLAVNMDFSGNRPVPQVSFQPSVSISRPDAVIPMPVINATRSVDGSGLANVNGVVQSVQVAGDGNLASNVVRLNVRDGGTLSGVAGQTQGTAAINSGDASASAGFDGRDARVQLGIAGLGSVQQWIRNGSLGQSVQLAADNQTASNLMQIDLIRQSLASNMQLSQSVAQAINLARGIGGP
ncbi:hypothetical protein RHOFW510R12_08545 [Rhodanobacter sp. FW510-R12]|uniref:hypothetical protein n=1 Tax=unclassified Rhodanobacter TaxID=2621553 RepID=UPI0007A9F5FD|nr:MULTISPECIES: hypothetical protein [unclassified Rhodanobacter]KZC18032.1 hypothetical protein RHOFW104R8_08385 [Rhodanobacter sp. FW104-R8]KZC28135.1 hypothetical protein RhoFW510T8_12070 [Rhodanobacter sp. FW510-T8]KZC33334.1 hypothetical protein RhoFW510R10_08350 [Rhodanobacter sp. FW510-R10]